MVDGCLFCRIASGDIPSKEVYSDDEFYAFRDVNPVAPTHILIVPRKHIPKITNAEPCDAALLGRVMLVANKIAKTEGLTGNGFRYVMNCDAWGGQTVFHIHMHVMGGRVMTWPPG